MPTKPTSLINGQPVECPADPMAANNFVPISLDNSSNRSSSQTTLASAVNNDAT
jgi:hypothetical protein